MLGQSNIFTIPRIKLSSSWNWIPAYKSNIRVRRWSPMSICPHVNCRWGVGWLNEAFSTRTYWFSLWSDRHGNLFASYQRYSFTLRRTSLRSCSDRFRSTSSETSTSRPCHRCTYHQRESERGNSSLTDERLTTINGALHLGFQTKFRDRGRIEFP